MTLVKLYVQNPETCDEQSFWIQEDGAEEPNINDGSDGWIGGSGYDRKIICSEEEAALFLREEFNGYELEKLIFIS